MRILIESEVASQGLAIALAGLPDPDLVAFTKELLWTDQNKAIVMWEAITAALEYDMVTFCHTCKKWLPDGHPIPSENNHDIYLCPYCSRELTDANGRLVLPLSREVA